jgi:hypothetical protein
MQRLYTDFVSKSCTSVKAPFRCRKWVRVRDIVISYPFNGGVGAIYGSDLGNSRARKEEQGRERDEDRHRWGDAGSWDSDQEKIGHAGIKIIS